MANTTSSAKRTQRRRKNSKAMDDDSEVAAGAAAEVPRSATAAESGDANTPGAASDDGASDDDQSQQPELDDDNGENGDIDADADAGASAGAGAGAGLTDVSGKVLTKEALEAFRKREKKKGVIYLSTIPPFMKPQKVRHLLSKYGEIGRLYLVPEDDSVKRRRRKSGGSKKTNYVEGWVEFLNKKHAKAVAAALNNRKVGGKRRSFHYEDTWNMKYLPKFKWNHLTQKIAYERRIRAQRLKAELAQAKREAAFYVDRAEQAKSFRKQEVRKLAEAAAADRRASRGAGGGTGGGAGSGGGTASAAAAAAVEAERRKVRRKFRQVAVVGDGGKTLNTKLLKKMAGGGASPKRKRAANSAHGEGRIKKPRKKL